MNPINITDMMSYLQNKKLLRDFDDTISILQSMDSLFIKSLKDD